MSDYQQIATAFGYQNELYGEWLVEPDGPRRALLEHWDPEDLSAFVGGEFVTNKETE